MRDTAPLGAALTTTSIEEPTPEEEEEEEEEEEGEDDDDGIANLLAETSQVLNLCCMSGLDRVLQHLTAKTMNRMIQMTRLTL